MVPVTTTEEVRILSEEERADMVASLKEAEARIAAGQYVSSTIPTRLLIASLRFAH